MGWVWRPCRRRGWVWWWRLAASRLLSPVDQNGYGSLGADTADSVMKMGVNLQPTSFALAAPTSSGQSITYVIQAAFTEADVSPVVLPYYNAANPTQPFLGAGNSGVAQATLRQQRVQLELKAGAAGITGSQATPPVDSGWTGLAAITVNYGQTQIVAANITVLPNGAVLPYKIPALRPGFSTMQAFTASGVFTVPNGVTTVRVTAIGGGGAGGTHATLPGGGGGAGGQALGIVTGLVAGTQVPVTVGAEGLAQASPANGNNGGTSSFGTFLSATGGIGGAGGTAQTTCAGRQWWRRGGRHCEHWRQLGHGCDSADGAGWGWRWAGRRTRQFRADRRHDCAGLGRRRRGWRGEHSGRRRRGCAGRQWRAWHRDRGVLKDEDLRTYFRRRDRRAADH